MSKVATAHESHIQCQICKAYVHSIAMHLQQEHAGTTLEDYKLKFPDAPVLSDIAKRLIEERRIAEAAKGSSVRADTPKVNTTTKSLADVFELGANKSAKNSRGQPIPVTVILDQGPYRDMVPDIDPNYIFNVDVLKTLMMGIEMRIPAYLWGHAGTGKTTIYEQIAARTGRPLLRVQHTANMEEEHVLGGWRLRDGKTVFEKGPLVMAMENGWIYLADEYDFGRPEVLSVYQSVLEGKALVIKEADIDNRIIRPHPQFRFVATGNTNGQGDETGLYQGTTIQNAANYERFGIVDRMPYMEEAVEANLVSKQAGIPIADAKKLVDFANRVRTEFSSNSLSNPISPRSLIFAAKIGVGRANYLVGLQKAYLNRLPSVDCEAATQLAQRVFGSGSGA